MESCHDGVYILWIVHGMYGMQCRMRSNCFRKQSNGKMVEKHIGDGSGILTAGQLILQVEWCPHGV